MSLKIIEDFCTRNPCWKANVERADSRYVKFQTNGPSGGMLHSVACAQPSAKVFVNKWNNESYDRACPHGVIDANDGSFHQTLKWNFRGWHGGGACNNYMIGVEMCESKYIRYTGHLADFEILNKAKAQADCKRAYETAVQLFAMLSIKYGWNPDTDIMSHKEGGKAGIASGHIDPEHYWTGLGMPYTMNTFRADVKRAIAEQEEKEAMPTAEELEQIVTTLLDKEFQARFDDAYAAKMKALSDNDSGKWSEKARLWAVDNGIIAGVGKNADGSSNYAWEMPLTREQYVVTQYKQRLREDGA